MLMLNECVLQWTHQRVSGMPIVTFAACHHYRPLEQHAMGWRWEGFSRQDNWVGRPGPDAETQAGKVELSQGHQCGLCELCWMPLQILLGKPHFMSLHAKVGLLPGWEN